MRKTNGLGARGWMCGTALVSGVLMGVCAPGAVALAQTATTAATPPSDADASLVGEIVVQATRRSERLQDVPEAVAVITGQSLTSVGPINNSQDVLNLVPGARFNNLSDPLNSEISLRGSGTERATGADSSVGLYFDNVYIGASQLGGRNLSPIDSFDLDHVEVLEGPQGALYGRDAEFGVVNMLPQQPLFSNSAVVDDTYMFQTQQNILDGVINYKVNDHLALRVGAEDITQSKGFEYDPDSNTYYDHTSGYIVRGQVRYQNENLDVDLLAERQQMQVPSFWSAYDAPPKNAATGYPGIATIPLGFVQNPRSIAHNGLDYSEDDISNVILNVNYDLKWAKLTSTTSWRDLYTIAAYDDDYLDPATESNLQSLCVANKLATANCGNYPFGLQNDTADTNTWYEDLHLDGAPMFNNHVTWLAGVELMDQRTHGFETLTSNPCPVETTIKLPGGGSLAIPAGNNVADGFCEGPPPFQQVAVLPGQVFPAVSQPGGSYANYRGSYFSWAPYASLTLSANGFSLNGDVRYSHDHKETTTNNYQIYSNQTIQTVYVTTGQPIGTGNYLLDSGNVTYAITASWKLPFMPWSDMVYAKTGTGYRVGGFNLGHTSPELANCTITPLVETGCPAATSPPLYYAPITPTYSDETSTSYEIGFKGDITRHAYFTLDGYYETTNNALAAVGDGCGTVLIAGDRSSCLAANTNYTVNAGETNGWGIEAQLSTQWDVVGGKLALQLDASTQKAWYASEPSGVPGLPVVGTPVAENPLWVASVLFNYSHPITEDVSAFFNMVYHGQWGGVQDPETTAGVFFPLANYQDIDLKTGVNFKALEVSLVVTNLTNEVHKMAQFYQPGANTLTGQAVAVYSQQRLSLPRSIGVEATYKW
ncbi:MAG TPA: TonB-dependent receptor [Caulobacteraceae bacterium]|nr:TonB-dependent receptor [Caulobacteraceae bacterium]